VSRERTTSPIWLESLRTRLLIKARFDEGIAEDGHLAPVVLPDFFDCDPGFGVIVKHSLDQILELIAGFLLELTPKLVFLLPEHLVEVNRRERVLAHDHHEQHYAEGPDISTVTSVLLASLNLRSHVKHGATLFAEKFGFPGRGVVHFRSKGEISDSDFEVVSDEEIVQFKVSMAVALHMHIAHRWHYLLEKEVTSYVFCEATDFGYYVK